MAQDPVTRDELRALLEPIKEDIREVLSHLKEQNSRLAKTETAIAILQDRQPSSRQAMWWGTASGGFFGLVVMVLDYLRHVGK